MNLKDVLNKDSKYLILTSTLLVFSTIAGILFFKKNHYYFSSLTDSRFLELVCHNGIMLLFIVFISLISLGYLAWVEVVINGFVFGMGVTLIIQKYGGWATILLLFHSVFELPAMILSAYLGRAFSVIIYKKIRRKDSSFSAGDISSLRLLILVLLVLASGVESIPRAFILKMIHG
ncbi:hypothetical protein FCS82_08770 [Oenococcus sp. UCMA 14587]|nr:hypothetical protein [Oenococcus sp. UCMA 14587]